MTLLKKYSAIDKPLRILVGGGCEENFLREVQSLILCSNSLSFVEGDVVCLPCTCPVQEFRQHLEEFFGSGPTVLDKKYLILLNLDFYSKDLCDALLKPVEEGGENLLAFARIPENVWDTLKSRFIREYLPPTTPGEILKELQGSSNQKKIEEAQVKGRIFSNTVEARAFCDHNFQEKYRDLTDTKASAASVLEQAQNLLKELEAYPMHKRQEILEYFLNFFIFR